jgi:hypothetical protein
MSAFRVRRLTLTVVAAGLVVAAEGFAMLSAGTPHTHHASHPRTVAMHKGPKPYGGEPQPSQNSITPQAPWIAAVRFVRDYAAWQAGRLARLPAHDATERVIRLLEHAGRHRLSATTDVTRSIRMAASGEHPYLATSAIGTFLIGRQGSRWMAVSVPGD